MPDRKRPDSRLGVGAPQEPGLSARWDIYIARAKGGLLGTVEAPDEAAAIEAGAQHFGHDPKRLIAVLRSR
jgi:hypothetical protein